MNAMILQTSVSIGKGFYDGQKFNIKKLHTYSQLDAGMIHYKSLFNDDNHILKEASWIYEYDN